MIPATDMQARALGRLANQYRDSTNLRAVVSLFVSEVEEIRDAAITLEALRSIDTAEGYGLDTIGEILGQPRVLSGVVSLDFFDLHDGTGGPAAEGFGDTTDASAGLRFRSVNESPTANKSLSDAEYRPFLRSKIKRSQTEATPEDIIEAIQSVLPDDPPVAVHLTFGTSAVTATVQRVLSAEELEILNALQGIRDLIPVIPRPTGIALTVAGL